MMTERRVLAGLVLVALCSAGVARAQGPAPVTSADVSRLDGVAADIRDEITPLRRTDPSLARDVEAQLDDLSDEITYLRVKMRKEGMVTREEYISLRDRLETLRVKARGEKVSAQPVLPARGGSIPVGAEFDVRLQTSLNSGTAAAEQRFEATTLVDYVQDGSVVVPAGSVVRGYVSSYRAAGKIDRRGSLTLSFDEIRIGNRSLPLRASVVQALDGKSGDDTARIGAGAVVGAILGGLLGGGKGALLGVIVGGGGTMAATEGADVDLPAGTILRIRIDQPVDVLPSSSGAPPQ